MVTSSPEGPGEVATDGTTGANEVLVKEYPPVIGTEAEALNCEVAFEHTVEGEALATSVIVGTTVTVCVAVKLHPLAVEPVTV